MEPLWKKFPTYEYMCMGWRMGGGQEYSMQWQEWFAALDSSARDKYIAENPEPHAWEGFYNNIIRSFEREAEIKARRRSLDY